jgi:hypothetical protein
MVQAIGRHRVNVDSIADAPHNRLLDGKQARVLYTDPPWSDRMMSYFDTLREKQTNEGGDGNLTAESMMREVRNVIETHTDGHVFILWSTNNDLAQQMVEGSLAWMDVQYPEYRAGSGQMREYALICGATSPEYQFDLDIDGMSGTDLIRTIFTEVGVPGEFCYDPMCGQGSAAIGAVESGMRFAGNDFNRKRVNDAVDKIQAAEKRWEREQESE